MLFVGVEGHTHTLCVEEGEGEEFTPQDVLVFLAETAKCVACNEVFSTEAANVFSVYSGNRRFENNDTLPRNATLRVLPSMLGGKGGFGSLLRTLGSRKTDSETDNIEACRDLSGRRLRHTHNEQALREWMEKADEREAEKSAKRQAKLERAVATPKHTFDHHKLMLDLQDKSEEVSKTVSAALEKSKKKSNDEGEEAKKPSSSATEKLRQAVQQAKRGVKIEDDWSTTDTSADEDTAIPSTKKAKKANSKVKNKN
eukprot:m.13402 g.13402  ORF g.13402 m.13402 type:complete len:256 (-) comp7510_c0_seq1:23-790(-)